MSTKKFSFDHLNLTPTLLASLKKIDFKTPTPIQSKAIPIVLQNKDLIACAQTGTGKTAAFCLPILKNIELKNDYSALILTPTRELATQIKDFLKLITEGTSGIRVGLIIGGIPLHTQLKMLKNQPQILVATPGRLVDHIQRQTVDLGQTNMIVLDEADRMLDMGFIEELNRILKYLPKKRQTLMFSATISTVTKSLASRYLYKPEHISVGSTSTPIDKIKQIPVETDRSNKLDCLLNQLNSQQGSSLIFVKTRRGVEVLSKELLSYGYKIRRIHGERTQAQRNSALEDFKNGTCRILIATDVAARGIDVPNIQVVINYDTPQTSEDYVHRIGRTGRAGASGVAVNFLTPENERQWGSIVNDLEGKGPKFSTQTNVTTKKSTKKSKFKSGVFSKSKKTKKHSSTFRGKKKSSQKKRSSHKRARS